MANVREPGTWQKAKSARTHDTIVRGVVACLDARGYAETSINHVLAAAGVSRGALQHHFRTKEDLIAATAAWLMERSLSALRTMRSHESRDPAAELHALWRRVIHTRDYRALLEILNAMRTDANLRERIVGILQRWNASFDEEMLLLYAATSGNDEEVVELMTMGRCLMRGLIIQETFAETPARIEALVARWIAMVTPALTVRRRTR